jgi:hypothetical protein
MFLSPDPLDAVREQWRESLGAPPPNGESFAHYVFTWGTKLNRGQAPDESPLP